jgi:two-component system phosphate regulon response regulator PhoB
MKIFLQISSLYLQRLSHSTMTRQRELAVNTEKKKIVVIDDNDDIRDLIQLICEKAGKIVIQGEDGVKGLALIKTQRPDLILLDTTMPGISGLDVLTAIRKDRDSVISAIPVVMLTANSAEADIKKAYDIGASSYIVKPFKREKILAEIDLLLQLEEA